MKTAKTTGIVPDANADQCPKCGKHLKQVRCRIDAAEFYCTRCGHYFDARDLRNKAGK
jgi:predicted RNA-binding Zn-ribbon protein involved in translation (DUF1610 family)